MTSSIAVEGQLCGIAAFRISFPKSGRDKTGAGGMGDAIPDDSAGKQVDDSAKVDSGIVDFKIERHPYFELFYQKRAAFYRKTLLYQDFPVFAFWRGF